MDPELKKALEVLGFINPKKIPKLREIVKNWRKLSIEKHPDKNGGTAEATSAFQELVAAYQLAGDACDTSKGKESEVEDIIAQKMFRQFQLSSIKENSNSYTIKTEKELNNLWCEILKVNLGNPEDKGNHGKKFTFIDECESPLKVTLTLYKASGFKDVDL